MEQQEAQPLDAFHWHEALDRASLFANMVEADLLQHPAVQAAPEVLALVDAACTALFDAYQALGVRRDNAP